MMSRSRWEQIQLISELDLCPQCAFHFLSPPSEDILSADCNELVTANLERMSKLMNADLNEQNRAVVETIARSYQAGGAGKTLCPCCFDAISYNVIADLSDRVVQSVVGRCSTQPVGAAEVPVCLEVSIPPIMDAYRITARTAITSYAEKQFAFPAIDELLKRVIAQRLKDRLNIVPAAEARIKITLQALANHQMEFCTAMWEDFALKKVKRKFQPNAAPGLTNIDEQDSTPNSINRKSIDSLLMRYKAYDEGLIEDDGHDELLERLKVHMRHLAPDAQAHRVAWTVTSSACPIYLLGRYRKLARDVPQSPWTVSTQSNGVPEGDVEGQTEVNRTELGDSACEEPPTKQQDVDGEHRAVQLQYKRKGRCSVEEIVTTEVKARLQAADCRMHPCGREDIDVRCLGNGRPFAMEVLDPAILFPDQALLDAVRDCVNRGEGLNSEKDVELALLTLADRGCWEMMQTKAEEKKKGYCCVVWVDRAITAEDLQRVEALSRSGAARDEAGEACIVLSQKTPLRVLHRRSLLDRPRIVYQIEATLINSHFFLMRLVTSAGTYVKEFVHGDMGRTTPSIAGLLQTQADIMQLDVTWLYDDMEGSDPAAAVAEGQSSEVSTGQKV